MRKMRIDYKLEIKKTDKTNPKDIVDLILKQRKIDNINDFINPKSPLDISLPDLDKKYKTQLNKVFDLLKKIKDKEQMIVVYTDYDADGITGGAILWETLFLLGFKTMPYVPDRKKEGYGFSKTGIDNVIKKFSPALIISVDHGITKIKEISYAKSKGIKIIVTDHHVKGDSIPEDAEAIFHIPELSGSGVSYFFSKEIFKHFRNVLNNKTRLDDYFLTDYLSLASIGTIADLVPLIGPSRSVAKYGLRAFSKVKRPGLRFILKQAGIANKIITPYEVGFIIAPRINAIGRLEHAIEALRLLCTFDEKKAHDLSIKVSDINAKRQDIVERSVTEAKKLIPKKLDKIIILSNDSWIEGIIGLIASKLAEEFFRPVIIMTKSDGVYKGSARSIPTFHMTNFLRSMKKYLIDAGGHAQASGFTIDKKNISAFKKAAIKTANDQIKDKDLERFISADIKIPISKIDFPLMRTINQLEPFGIGNPRPLFLSQAILINASILGKTHKHLKIFVKDKESNSFPMEMIAFNQADKMKELSRGDLINIAYYPEIDNYGGREKIKGKVYFLSRL